MKITALGCSGGIGAGLRTTCLRIDDDILIDAGTGLGDMPLEQMARVRHIFLTHSHLDHVTGIPLMVDSVFELARAPVVVHGQPETLEALKEHVFNWTIWPDFGVLPSKERPVLRWEPMLPGDVFELEGRTLEMIAVNHQVPGVGYRVEDASGVFAFSGDTTTNDTFWEALNRYPRLDALLVECSFLNKSRELSEKSFHYCPSMLAADIAKLKHKPQVYISHLKPGDEEALMEECRLALPDFKIHRVYTGDEIPVQGNGE